MPVRNFGAQATASTADSVTVSAGGTPYSSPDLDSALSGNLPADLEGLERLVLAALRRFMRDRPLALGASARRAGLSFECATTIPRQAGLAGSSAMIIATLRALASLFGTPIARFDLAELALATEVEDLDIAAGPMDRVIQSYEQVMVLDLEGSRTEANYRTLDPTLVPRVLLAWTPSTGRPSGLTHSDLRARWVRGDPDVLRAMSDLREVVDLGVGALLARDRDAFADVVDRNYELRVGVTRVTELDERMVRIARAHGAAAKLCGSGGSVLVVPRADTDVRTLEAAFADAGFRTCEPTVA